MGLTKEEQTILEHVLHDDEGFRSKPYRDTVGKLTIGIGRNLDAKGISFEEGVHLLRNDMLDVIIEIDSQLPWFRKLNSARRVVVFCMVFNLGMAGFKGFKQTIKCIESGDYASAARRMLESKWAGQVGSRAIRLAELMRTGQF